MKPYDDIDIQAVRWINRDGKVFWAVEVLVTEYEGGNPIYLRAKNLISGKHFRNIGRMILKAAGYEVHDNYSDFIRDGYICGNFVDGTKQTALDSLKRTWICNDGTIPDIRAVAI